MKLNLERGELPFEDLAKRSNWVSVTGRIRINERDLFNTQSETPSMSNP